MTDRSAGSGSGGHSAPGPRLAGEALGLLRRLTGDPGAEFRPNQLDAIERLVGRRERVLLVQRTGWGKSAVYFIATRMLRDRGSGPTLLVSPLLALMRNQIKAAQRMDVRAETINSANREDWNQVLEQLDRDAVDLLLISPERLANPDFRSEVLPGIGRRSGLLVVDEAHCISDWGHDFRPDYRRITRVLGLLPAGVPVLCCTATANDRVVEDSWRNSVGPHAAARPTATRRTAPACPPDSVAGRAPDLARSLAPASRRDWNCLLPHDR